jgi:CheY-like chemotaxis protein
VKHILVVDDETDGADMLAVLLELEGYSVETASDGRECMAKIAARLPDLIVLDLMMPVMSGWDVLEALARDERLRGIPVIVCSAARAAEAGARYGHPCVSKPIELDTLRRIVSDLLPEE